MAYTEGFGQGLDIGSRIVQVGVNAYERQRAYQERLTERAATKQQRAAEAQFKERELGRRERDVASRESETAEQNKERAARARYYGEQAAFYRRDRPGMGRGAGGLLTENAELQHLDRILSGAQRDMNSKMSILLSDPGDADLKLDFDNAKARYNKALADSQFAVRKIKERRGGASQLPTAPSPVGAPPPPMSGAEHLPGLRD